jgi:RNA recognition motif-containing protein
MDGIIYACGGVLVGVVVGFLVGRSGRRSAGGGGGSGADVEIYVGNLSYEVTEKDLQKAFEEYGRVGTIRIIRNRLNGKSKGYGFIEMHDRGEALEAVRALNGKDMKGRRIVANEAKSSARDN